MSEATFDPSTIPPALSAEFFLYLWFASEAGSGKIPLEDGEVQFWVEDRLGFRVSGDNKPSTILTGERPSASPEARAALKGGKLLRDLRLGLRREDREYFLLLKGPRLEMAGARLPGLVKTGEISEILFERMFLYEEAHFLLGQLWSRFADRRFTLEWEREILPRIRAWVWENNEGALDVPG